MAQKINIDQINLIIDSSLELASESNWREVSLEEIASKSKLELIDVKKYFPNKTAIILEIFKRIDDEVLGNHDELESESVKDRLFDVFMERFDALNENRSAILSILNSMAKDPIATIETLPNFKKSMLLMLELAGIENGNIISEKTRFIGISGIYLSVLRIWIDDESEDLSRTMAELDKRLSQTEEFVNSFSFLNKKVI